MGSGFSTIAVPAGFFSGLTMDSNPEADGGTSILKKKGYYVRIARRAPARREVKEGLAADRSWWWTTTRTCRS